MFVLDTNIVSEPNRPQPDPRVLAWLDAHSSSMVCTTSVTLAELHFGLALLQPSRRRDRLVGFIKGVVAKFEERILPFTAADAPYFGEIFARRQRVGLPISTQDAMIAAIAWRHGMTLVTRNTRDFLDLGIDLVDPFVG